MSAGGLKTEASQQDFPFRLTSFPGIVSMERENEGWLIFI